jgi:hypothetical protein
MQVQNSFEEDFFVEKPLLDSNELLNDMGGLENFSEESDILVLNEEDFDTPNKSKGFLSKAKNN